MKDKQLIFQTLENRELFETKNLINKTLSKKTYQEVFSDKALLKILNNPSINESVDAFLSGNLNLTTASANSYVHRNTLIYRIKKIYNSIGLDLKNFDDCVIYKNARLVYTTLFEENWLKNTNFSLECLKNFISFDKVFFNC